MLATIGLPLAARGPSGVGVGVGSGVGVKVEVGSGVGVATSSDIDEHARLITNIATRNTTKNFFGVHVILLMRLLVNKGYRKICAANAIWRELNLI